MFTDASAELLPRRASGEWSYNASPPIQDNVVTAGSRQYVLWIDDQRTPVVAARNGSLLKWQVFPLSAIPGNPLKAPADEDGHNFFSMAVDADGYLHVSGNHHYQKLRYVRSSKPHSIESWEPGVMVGADEDVVTYPQFFQLPDRTLYFLFRDGAPGRGDCFLNRYDTASQTWKRLHKLVDGRSDHLSFYPNHISTRDGSIHIMGVWRARGGAHLNRDIVYFRSDDEGRTWVQADGSPQQIPVRVVNADIAVATAEDSGLVNSAGLEVDEQGRPHGAFQMYDADGYTQLFHIWHDGQRWHKDQATALTHRMQFLGGFTDNRVSHPAVITSRRGDVFILYRAHERGDVIRVVDVTPGRERCEFTLEQPSPLDFWNVLFDTRGLYEQDRLTMLVVPTGHPQDPEISKRLSDWSSVGATLVASKISKLLAAAEDCRAHEVVET